MGAGSDGTKLNCGFTFSYMRRGGGGGGANKGAGAPASKGAEGGGGSSAGEEKTTSTTSTAATASEETTTKPVVNPYENCIRTITTVYTVESFWQTYDFLKRPNDLPTTTDYHFFKAGIKPTWEDPSNARGGKWIVRLPKGLASRYWEEIILALIGGQFTGVPYDEICGAVLSVRYSEDILGVWNKTANDREIVERIRDAVKKILQLPSFANMEYKPHQTSIADRSSFRNTQVWKPKSSGDLGGGGGGGGRGGGSSHEPRHETRRSGSWGEASDGSAGGGTGGVPRSSPGSSHRATSFSSSSGKPSTTDRPTRAASQGTGGLPSGGRGGGNAWR